MIKADALRKLLVKVERGDYVDFDLLGQNIQKIRESFEKIDARWNEKGEGGNHGSCLGRLLPYYAQEAVKSFENVLAAECRSEERRVGKECVSTGRSRCSLYHENIKHEIRTTDNIIQFNY